MTLILMGLRGSGKSTIGRAMAEHRGVTFADLDDATPAVLGCATVAHAWARHGEAAFRRAEVAALEAVLRRGVEVLALGGGTPTAPGAAEALRRARQAGASLVYLRAQPTVLRSRLEGSGLAHRPSLTGADPLDEIEEVFQARDPLYLGLADRVVETDEMDAERVLRALSGEARG